jgi:hypothetical protein
MIATPDSLRTTWDVACNTRESCLPWLKNARVELDRDPTKNIGGLHGKLCEVRTHANHVRDALFDAMQIEQVLRREAQRARGRYEGELSRTLRAKIGSEELKPFKSKEERESYLRQDFADLYTAQEDSAGYVVEWELYVKSINIIYWSLDHTRKEIDAQVNIVRQQMFNGEVKPNAELKQLGALGSMLGAAGREFVAAMTPEDPEALMAPSTGGSVAEVSFDDSHH